MKTFKEYLNESAQNASELLKDIIDLSITQDRLPYGKHSEELNQKFEQLLKTPGYKRAVKSLSLYDQDKLFRVFEDDKMAPLFPVKESNRYTRNSREHKDQFLRVVSREGLESEMANISNNIDNHKPEYLLRVIEWYAVKGGYPAWIKQNIPNSVKQKIENSPIVERINWDTLKIRYKKPSKLDLNIHKIMDELSDKINLNDNDKKIIITTLKKYL